MATEVFNNMEFLKIALIKADLSGTGKPYVYDIYDEGVGVSEFIRETLLEETDELDGTIPALKGARIFKEQKGETRYFALWILKLPR